MKFYQNIFAICIISLLTWNCQYIVDLPGDGDNNPSDHDSVIIKNINPDSLQFTPFNLNEVTVKNDVLTLNVSYGGGCQEHEFELYMTPPTFMESNPVQANIYLRHDGNGDTCEAYLTEDVSFDISKIAENYRDAYQSRAGVVLLNVYKYYEDNPGERIQVSYTFL